MATIPTKTAQTALIAWQDVASAALVVGSALDVSSKWGGAYEVRLGRRTGTAFTAGSPNIRIEASLQTSGNLWTPVDIFQPFVGATIGSTTLNGALSASDTTIVLTSGTNFLVGDIIFLGHSSAANYELVRVKTKSTNTLTVEEAISFAHANAAIVTSQAEEVICYPPLNLTSYMRLRAIVDNLGSGQDISVQVALTTFDSF